MVQEVQQQGNRYQDPKLIPWVWISERKVREHTQVSPSFSYNCTANGGVSIPFWDHETVEKRGTINSISSSYWNTTFRVSNWGLRIPLAWAYQVEFTGKWGVAAAPVTHYLRLGTKTLMQVKTTSSSGTTIATTLNLWRGNLLEYYGKVVNSTSWGNVWSCEVILTLKKL